MPSISCQQAKQIARSFASHFIIAIFFCIFLHIYHINSLIRHRKRITHILCMSKVQIAGVAGGAWFVARRLWFAKCRCSDEYWILAHMLHCFDLSAKRLIGICGLRLCELMAIASEFIASIEIKCMCWVVNVRCIHIGFFFIFSSIQ